jgi:hypothetical protein
MTTTPRIECRTDKTYTSLSDFAAAVTRKASPTEIIFEARGRLLSSAHKPLPEGEIQYHLTYRFAADTVDVTATVIATANEPKNPIELIVPVVSRNDESFVLTGGSVQIAKPTGSLRVQTDAKTGFVPITNERTFNLVPGFECIPLRVVMKPGEETRIQFQVN